MLDMRTSHPFRMATIAAVLVLTGCAMQTGLMTRTRQDARLLRPEDGQSLVVFLRPSRVGGAIQAPLYDDQILIGVSSAKTAIAYQTTPGKHLFMVVSEAADFLEADLAAGKTYYALVIPRTGWWRARFSLRPLDASAERDKIADWLDGISVVTVNEQGRKWERDNQPSVERKREAYLRKWRSKSVRPALRPEDGV